LYYEKFLVCEADKMGETLCGLATEIVHFKEIFRKSMNSPAL